MLTLRAGLRSSLRVEGSISAGKRVDGATRLEGRRMGILLHRERIAYLIMLVLAIVVLITIVVILLGGRMLLLLCLLAIVIELLRLVIIHRNKCLCC